MSNFIVYKHTSPSGKCYIGITSQTPEHRWGNNGYKYLDIHKNGKLKHPYFAQAILKYGWDNIKHELLHSGLSKEEACKLEQEYIMEYKSQGLSYNITNGGEGIWGFQFSEEQRENLGKVIEARSKPLRLWLREWQRILERKEQMSRELKPVNLLISLI